MASKHQEHFLIFDTNVLRGDKEELENFNQFDLRIVNDLKKFIKKHGIEKKVKLLFPEVVILELEKNKKDKLKKWLKNIKNYCDNFSEIAELNSKIESIDVDNHIKKIKDTTISGLEIASIPLDKKTLFEEIFIRAINKYPPFKAESSDVGFKDTILYLSLLEYAKNYSDAIFVFFTKDSGFSGENKEILENEFSKTGNTLKIQTNKDVDGYLLETFKLDIDFQTFVRATIEEIENILSSYTAIKIGEEKYPIVSIKISNDRTFEEDTGPDDTRLVLGFDVIYSKEEHEEPLSDLILNIDFSKSGMKIIKLGYNYELFRDGN